MIKDIIVLAKQVPDTRNVGKDAMKADGTVNRAALDAIFNPEDLNALEQALRIKEQNPDCRVSVLTMGPPRAAEIIREALYRGADHGYLLTDRAFAGADTLATSYALACAIRHIYKGGLPDLILGGRQAIDGDTAQVGPQVGEKLGINVVTYCEQIDQIEGDQLTITRRLEHGVETVRAHKPLLLTVTGSAAPCRLRNAKRVQKYKYAASALELDALPETWRKRLESNPKELTIDILTAESTGADIAQCGLSGSPTKVKSIESVVFKAKEVMHLSSSDADLETLIQTLLANHTIG